MGRGLPPAIMVYVSWGLLLLVSALWMRSYFVADGIGKAVPGRLEGLTSFHGHLVWAIYTSNAPDWKGLATWHWKVELGEPRGADLSGEGWRRFLAGGYYDQISIPPGPNMMISQFERGTRLEYSAWWLMYRVIWIPT